MNKRSFTEIKLKNKKRLLSEIEAFSWGETGAVDKYLSLHMSNSSDYGIPFFWGLLEKLNATCLKNIKGLTWTIQGSLVICEKSIAGTLLIENVQYKETRFYPEDSTLDFPAKNMVYGDDCTFLWQPDPRVHIYAALFLYSKRQVRNKKSS